jgi:hypothetical protein
MSDQGECDCQAERDGRSNNQLRRQGEGDAMKSLQETLPDCGQCDKWDSQQADGKRGAKRLSNKSKRNDGPCEYN